MKRFIKKIVVSGLSVLFISPVMALNSLDTANKALFYQAINESSIQSNDERMDILSRTLLGSAYVGGSVGEGEQGQYDKDPLTRFDVFDCTTYVETVLAGVMSSTSNDFEANLMRLRYKDAQVSFVTRNHFPSLDWFHNNQAILQDITPDVANGGARVASTIIDKAAWYQHISSDVIHCDAESSDNCRALLNQLHAEGKRFVPEAAYIPYVPLTELFLDSDRHINQALLDRIPSGSVITMVRPDWPLKQYIGTNMNVSHQGLAIRKNGTLFLRHASLTHKKVVDESFTEYFSHYPETSSLKGFNVQILRR
ncbi:N-acetylmuramoyl-L-alanine amidase-like domain-containing protein [Marinomonas lutimaris]|uniref:N-acetylmuramoyl-L-alanine amidase-like domain-containing protein n=1 Tax=Marinomonas lutimaris TaxID=2846746 RepID=UPI001C66BC35|nr:N-acetylmuramoyl-L-alanine amidase-like domain-containing protein [Marinomonas lutimaris]